MDGKVLTSKMEGCPTDRELCDVKVLLDRVTPFATTNRKCAKTKSKSSPTTRNNSSLDQDTPFVTTNLNYTATKPESRPMTPNNSSVDGVVLQLSAMLMAGLLGSLATFFVMTRRLPVCKDLRGDYLSLTRSHHTLSTSGEKEAEEAV
jgi:hypothetical protein